MKPSKMTDIQVATKRLFPSLSSETRSRKLTDLQLASKRLFPKIESEPRKR